MPSSKSTRKRILYSGDVQGVGFRQRSAWIARRHGLVGYVRNLADGRVELVAEAAPERIKDMMKDVAASFRDNISDCAAEDVPATEPLAGFDIRY